MMTSSLARNLNAPLTLQVPKAAVDWLQESTEKKMHLSECMTCILSVEHSMKETVAARGGRRKENIWDSILKSKMWSQSNARPVKQSFGPASIPSKFN